MDDYPVDKVYRLLEPGPVILLTTRGKDGTKNVMTIGFHMVVQHEQPPLLAVIVGPWDHSFKALRATKQCVIAIPVVEMANTVVDLGNCSGTELDKFEKFGLTAFEGSEVEAPLIEQCKANIECTVADTKMVSKYNMWILEPVKAWVTPRLKDHKTFHHRGDGTFTVDGKVINLQDRMTKWQEYQD